MAAKKQSQKQKNEPRSSVVPCWDHNSRTCIEVSRADGKVKFVMMTAELYDVEELSESGFDVRFKPIPDYPPERACDLFIEYMRKLGGTEAAIDALSSVSTITNQVRSEIMTAAKKRVPAAEKGDATPKTKAKAKAAAKPKAKRQPGEKRESAAQMFQDLIMQGRLTDDAIFKKVQEKYNLDDNKRSYVAWYRNKLKKDGKKPPEPK